MKFDGKTVGIPDLGFIESMNQSGELKNLPSQGLSEKYTTQLRLGEADAKERVNERPGQLSIYSCRKDPMKTYVHVLVVSLLILMIPTSEGMAQGRLKGKLRGGKRDITVLNQGSRDSTNRRQDVEGTVWEYKVIDPSEKDDSKETNMTGRLRIKQKSIFAVGKPKTVGEKENEDEETKESADSDIRGKFKSLLSQRMNEAKVQTTGDERIGDYSTSRSSEYKFEFDQDDDYPLSGLVKLKPDTKKNGVWAGNYEQFSGGKKVKRWRFEMRKIDE